MISVYDQYKNEFIGRTEAYDFKARGTCGHTAPKSKCRSRAKGNAIECMLDHVSPQNYSKIFPSYATPAGCTEKEGVRDYSVKQLSTLVKQTACRFIRDLGTYHSGTYQVEVWAKVVGKGRCHGTKPLTKDIVRCP